MLSKISKTVIAGAVTALGLGFGFGANKAAADSFSVSVHTPTVSAGYSNHHGHDGGYVAVRPAPPAVAYCPPPAPVVVVQPPRHVCSWDRVPVTRVRYDECGRQIIYTDYVRVRTCDDYHRRYDNVYYGPSVGYQHGHKHGHGHYKHYDDHHDHHKHGKHHKDDYRYSRNWDDDDHDHDRNRNDNHRGRDRD